MKSTGVIGGGILLAAMFVITTALPDRPKPATPRATSQPAAKALPGWAFDAKEAGRRRDKAAEDLGVPKQISLDLGSGTPVKLVLVPPGKFMMGSPGDEKLRVDNEPQHEVEITKAFYVAACDVTKGQFAAFVADTGYKTDSEKEGTSWAWDGTVLGKVNGASWQKPGFEQTDDHPVVCVSYNDAVAFCTWLGKKAGKTVKLPTEAQWEYACRAGTPTAYVWGNAPDDGRGWCNAADQTAKAALGGAWPCFGWADEYTFTSPVGKFKPNAFGLYDMQGNCGQWCADVYDPDYYGNSPKTDPTGPSTGQIHIRRGGSWLSNPKYCRIAYRDWGLPTKGTGTVGFRVVVGAN